MSKYDVFHPKVIEAPKLEKVFPIKMTADKAFKAADT